MTFLARYWLPIGAAIAALGIIWAIWSHFASDARLRGQHKALTQQSAQVLLAVRTASDNPKAKWETAAGQIVALGEAHKALKVQITFQNERIDALAADALRARAAAEELKRIADRAEAQRASALRRLSDMSATPGTRADCMTLLREAEAALDLMREAEAGV